MSARLSILLALGLALASACSAPAGPRVRAVDLLQGLERAEKRPAAGAFPLIEHTCGGERSASLAVPVASRVIHDLWLPDRAVFASQVAVDGPDGASVLFRVGVSDERIYEQLATITVTADECGRAWTPFEVDLRPFTGWKFSLFYQPSRRPWRLVLATNPVAGGPALAYWGRPALETDNAAARRYIEKLRSSRAGR